jgi:uncharacterized protein YfbU (UPF0304 family)
MDLTKKDRVFLINQYAILKRIDPENSSYYEEIIDILQHGYAIFYSMVDEWVSDDMPVEEAQLVLKILDFYRAVEDYKNNNPNDKELIDHPWSFFCGFDGNSEAGYCLFTMFLIDRQGKFSEQVKYREKTDNFNSHMPVLFKYKKMVDKWCEMDCRPQMLRDEIIAVLNAE